MSSNRLRKNAVFRPKIGWVCVQDVLMDRDESVEFRELLGELFNTPQNLGVRLYRITPEAAGWRT